MRRRLIDILLLLASGFISGAIAVFWVLSHTTDPWYAFDPALNAALITLLTLIAYLAINFSNQFYNQYRRAIVGILFGINLLTGIVLCIISPT
jgi:hypothetical protein